MYKKFAVHTNTIFVQSRMSMGVESLAHINIWTDDVGDTFVNIIYTYIWSFNVMMDWLDIYLDQWL